MKLRILLQFFLLPALFIMVPPLTARAYSVLTHEAIVDATCQKSWFPLDLGKGEKDGDEFGAS